MNDAQSSLIPVSSTVFKVVITGLLQLQVLLLWTVPASLARSRDQKTMATSHGFVSELDSQILQTHYIWVESS